MRAINIFHDWKWVWNGSKKEKKIIENIYRFMTCIIERAVHVQHFSGK